MKKINEFLSKARRLKQKISSTQNRIQITDNRIITFQIHSHLQSLPLHFSRFYNLHTFLKNQDIKKVYFLLLGHNRVFQRGI